MRQFLPYAIFTLAFLSLGYCCDAQSSENSPYEESIAVVARPTRDSITFRWAPLRSSVWQLGNKNGYRVERYVIVRDGKALNTPEKLILTSLPLKPWPEADWEPLVKRDRYGAITAQALFGTTFEVDLSKPDIFTIVNKAKENEQRFSFALFGADMSPDVAKASGLWFTDKAVKKGEKYLYRILIDQTEADSLRGSVVVGPDDPYALANPRNLQAHVKDMTVSLQWDKTMDGYTAYMVERSEDGKVFRSISDTPLVTVSPNGQEDTRHGYASDSLPDLSKTYQYRVIGISPFGEKSAPSNVVNAKGSPPVDEVPYIVSGINIDNKSIQLTWEFSMSKNAAIKGFVVERAQHPKGTFTQVTSGILPPLTRQLLDTSPAQTNYYRVTANALNGEKYVSALYYAQLVDSIPPAKPIGLKATVDKAGIVQLSWTPNAESDMFGYRVYKANNKSEELAQLTVEPTPAARYVDTLNLKTLNEYVYYSIVAIDRNQNQSILSELLKVNVPDNIKPQPPVFLPVKNTNKGAALSWVRSGSDDVQKYDVYRQVSDAQEWLRIKEIPVTRDTIYHFTDDTGDPGKINRYTVTAVDEVGLESDPAQPVIGVKIDNTLRPAIEWKPHRLNMEKNQLTLVWSYETPGVKTFRLYRAVGENSTELYKTIPAGARDFTDTLMPGKKYTYRVMVVFENDKQSKFSKEFVFTY